MSNAVSLREEEIQAIMRLPPSLRASFLQTLVAESASAPTQSLPPPQGPSDQHSPEDGSSEKGPTTRPHINEVDDVTPPAHTMPTVHTRNERRPPKRKRPDSPESRLPQPNARHQEGVRAEPSPPSAPIEFQGPCRRCYVKNIICVPNKPPQPGLKTSLRCRECYERHRKCEPPKPGDVPEVEELRTPSPVLTAPAKPPAPKRVPTTPVDVAQDSHQIGAQHLPSLDAANGTPTMDEIAKKITSLQSDFADALADQRNVNTAILRALHCLIERTETNRGKEEE